MFIWHVVIIDQIVRHLAASSGFLQNYSTSLKCVCMYCIITGRFLVKFSGLPVSAVVLGFMSPKIKNQAHSWNIHFSKMHKRNTDGHFRGNLWSCNITKPMFPHNSPSRTSHKTCIPQMSTRCPNQASRLLKRDQIWCVTAEEEQHHYSALPVIPAAIF